VGLGGRKNDCVDVKELPSSLNKRALFSEIADLFKS
jgi:hypothetical protein